MPKNTPKKNASAIRDKGQGGRFAHWLMKYRLSSLYANFKNALKRSENRNINRVYIRARRLRNQLRGVKFRFVTADDAVVWTSEWLKSFPIQYDIIVGIPRSGMLIASVIALKLGKPLTTPDLFAENEFWLSTKVDQRPDFTKRLKVLLVDDSINSGKSMQDSIDIMRRAGLDFDVTRAALIASDEADPLVDMYYTCLKHPRIFEWNILHRKTASYFEQETIAVDMDGVLCEDCPKHVDADENKLQINGIYPELTFFWLTHQLRYSRYYEHLVRWAENFSEDRLHIFLFEKMTEDPCSTVRNLVKNVDIDGAFYDQFNFDITNPTRGIKFLSIHNWYFKNLGRINAFFRGLAYLGLYFDYKNRYLRFQGQYGYPEEPDPISLQRLDDYFSPHNQQLEKAFSLNLGCWKVGS